MMITHEQISRRAYKIWEREGRPDGKEQEHWFQAEHELREESQNKGQRGTSRTSRARKATATRH